MDFIERWFGLSPDGGSGSLEITLVIAALVAVAALLRVTQFKSAAGRSRTSNERGCSGAP